MTPAEKHEAEVKEDISLTRWPCAHVWSGAMRRDGSRRARG